uniref:Maf-like protein n=1 Tax=Heterosigma akashiwo TaxID=2829 RepID=A0A6V1TL15_HETAK
MFWLALMLVFQTAFSLLVPNSAPSTRMLMMQSQGDTLISRLPSKIILGSKSFTRQMIVKEMGMEPIIRVADIDEKAIGDRSADTGWDPERLVLALGNAKADAILESGLQPGDHGLLLTGDQVVVHEGRILEKPTSLEEARQFIEGYARAPPRTVGSAVLTDLATGRRLQGVDTATIRFAPFPPEVVDRLLADEMTLHCAGGLMVEHELVQPYLEGIDGTVDSVMGLSKRLTETLIRRMLNNEEEEGSPSS